MNTSVDKIGFIGIGTMGTPMAGNPAKAGYKLVIYDADPKRALAQHTSAVWNNAEQQLGPVADHTEMFRYLKTLQR